MLGSSFLVVVAATLLQAAVIPSPAPASEPPRTVMTWIQTNVKLWPVAVDFFTTGAGKGAINAVSIGNMAT